jgi:hypothetical protein
VQALFDTIDAIKTKPAHFTFRASTVWQFQ